MEIIVEAIYKKQTNELNIRYADKVFDISPIQDIPLEQWVFPFFAKGVHWGGIYEELKAFTGSEEFILRFDSDDDSFETVKQALHDMPVKLVGKNNVVTIIYHENPITTKIVVNGKIFDTTSLQNRYIDEWIAPIQIRGIKWSGIFKELENYIGTDLFTIYFVGEQKFMKLLIENCPENINIFYKDTTQMPKSKTTANIVPALTSKVNIDSISATANKTIASMKQNKNTAENSSNTADIPIKHSFIRNNIITICTICSIIFLFLPFAGFSATSTIEGTTMESNTSKTNGFETIFGIKDIKVGTNTSVFAVFLLIIPVLIIVLNYIKISKLPKKWIAVVAPLFGIIVEIITVLDIRGLYRTFITGDNVKLKTSLGIGFFLILVSYLFILGISLVIYHNFKLPDNKNN